MQEEKPSKQPDEIKQDRVVEERRLCQDLIDQLLGSVLKSRRSIQLDPSANRFEDIYQDIGDVWTNIQGYELFLFHYSRRTRHEPMCNPWKLNLGKIVVPNVFVNMDLFKLLAKHYNPNLKAICNLQGKPFVYLSKAALEEVFGFEDICDY